MSTKLTGYVWDGCAASGMKLSSVAIMARLADFSNDEGVCWPSIETIARQIGAGMSTVRTAIARLEAEGWLTRKARRQGVPSVTRESDLVPSVPATSIIQDKAKKVLALKVDPESPESFMLRPKRRRWVNEKYTRWVKTQPCACCGKPADDPHHLIGHGQGGMGTKAHDLFVLPLCRKHHDELHADTVAFEEKYGSQLELIFRFIDRALAIGVLA